MATIVIYFLLGLIFGSFVSMASYRLIQQSSLLGRSQCTSCQHILTPRDLIPLISYVSSKGLCRHCGSGISLRYPVIELATALVFAITGAQNFPIYITILLLLMSIALMIMIVTDFEHFIIPDETTVFLAINGVFFAFLSNYSLIQVLVSPMLVGGLALIIKYTFKFLMKKDGLGMGDVKFFAVAGIYLPPETISAFFFLSGMLGILISIIWKYSGRGERFPFGPALAMALYTCLVFQ